MRSGLPLLCCATLGAAFVPNATPPASKCGLSSRGGQPSRCRVPWESVWREVRAHNDGDGSGIVAPASPTTSAAPDAEIEATKNKMEAVENEIQAVKAALSGGTSYLGIFDGNFLSKQLEQLREDKKQLREDERQLREEKLLLLKNPAAAAVPLAASKSVSDFAAALTGAVVTEDTLKLVNGTFFLGNHYWGSKLFIRPCYKEMAAFILSGDERKIVVTGTPGIGKSVFGFYLLYLLRCEGKTVLFERKGDWYRFGDEGAQKGVYSDFVHARYLDDEESWYLSDPEGRPNENFVGTTIVLVSPDFERMKGFLKLPTSKRIFMPVWSLEELLECRRVVFPHVPRTDVVKSFGVVGGVARAIFDLQKLKILKEGILTAVGEVDVALLKKAVGLASWQNGLETKEVCDKLFHISSNSGDNFEGHTVTLASNYTRDSIVRQVAARGRGGLLTFVGASIRNPDVSRLLGGGSTVGNLFEQAAHLEIGGRRAAEAPFNMAILNATRSEALVGKRKRWDLSFNEIQVFKGNKTSSTYTSEIYYRPDSLVFPGIDSFALDSRDDTLYFFQMKYTGAEPIKQGSKVESFWDAAVASEDVLVKKCVLVFVVPEGAAFEKSKVLSKCWLPGASTDFASACGVCVVGIRC